MRTAFGDTFAEASTVQTATSVYSCVSSSAGKSNATGRLPVNGPLTPYSPVVAGSTLKEAYLAAMAKHFPFDGKIPAELLFTKPQWNNWIEIAIQGMRQSSVDAYTEALAASGFPCGVYMMDGGWFSHMGSYKFYADDYPDPKGMFRRIREKLERNPAEPEHIMTKWGVGYYFKG